MDPIDSKYKEQFTKFKEFEKQIQGSLQIDTYIENLNVNQTSEEIQQNIESN